MEPPSKLPNAPFCHSILSNEQAQLLSERYFLIVGIAKKIRDTRIPRFSIVSPDSSTYILQIAQTKDEIHSLQQQIRVLHRLANHLPEWKIPKIVLTVSGETLAHHTHRTGSLALQLLHVPAAKTLEQAKLETPPWVEIGQFVAKLARELFKIDNEQYAEQQQEGPRPDPLDWNHRFLHLVDSEELQDIVRSSLRAFQTHTQPYLGLGKIRTSLVHRQMSPNDLLVDVGSIQQCVSDLAPPLASRTTPVELPSHSAIIGIRNFFDLQTDYLINELAVTLSNVLGDGSDLLESASIVIAAYHQVFPLQEDEIGLLYDFLAFQWCTTIVHAARKLHQNLRTSSDRHPDSNNAHSQHYMDSLSQASTLLRQWQALNRHLVHFHFRHACGFPAVPHGRFIERWLAQHHNLFSSVLDMDLRTASWKFLKCAKGEPEVLRYRSATSIDAYCQDLWQRMETQSIDVFVGPYLEDREIYQSESYSTNIPGDRRSIHLGVDLFLPAKRPVFAPLAGTVYSIQDNDLPLDYGPTLILSHSIPHLELHFFTLYGHLSRETLLQLKPNQRVERGEQIACLGDWAENGNWAPHLHFQIMTDIMELHGNFPGVASPREIAVWRQICIDPNFILSIEPLRPSEVLCDQEAPNKDSASSAIHRITSNGQKSGFRAPT